MTYSLITLFIASPNFATNDASLADAAEAARLHSALFWTNQPLAGNWSQPCPIVVQPRDTPAGGATSFRFDRGEVFGWSMTLAGRRASIFADALPHEVDHMVRATLVRRPILRWLDEGAAALFESREEHARHRARAIRFAQSGRSPTFIHARDYPTQPDRIADLYAVGFSLTEHLLKLGTRRQLLALQASADPLDQTLQRTHRLTTTQLVESWRDSVLANSASDCQAAGCVIHSTEEHAVACSRGRCEQPNRMIVWSASWCDACQQFWNDYRSDAEFRAAVDSRVHIHVADVDRYPLQARTHNIHSLPTFVTSRGRLEGYRGKDRFLTRLQSLAGGSMSPSTSSQTDLPEPSEPSPAEYAIGSSQSVPPSALVDVDVDPPTCPTPSHGRRYTIAGLTLTTLEWFGLAGATTGPAGLALAAFSLWRRRRRKLPTPHSSPPHSLPRPPEVPPSDTPQRNDNADYEHAPFPRELDEARELLRLRQREGRVAALDAIRGMVVDDELDRLAAAGQSDIAESLRQRLNDRVQQIAPIASK